MASDPKWQKFQRACEWPIATIAFGSALLVLAYRLGALPRFEPGAIWSAGIVGMVAGVGTLTFIFTGFAKLWAAHATEATTRQRALKTLKAGLALTVAHSVCRACIGRGFTWTVSPSFARAATGMQIQAALRDAPTRLKTECPSCGGSGFIGQ